VKTLMKTVLYLAPVVALIFLYVIAMQGQVSTEIDKENAQFDRDWAEFHGQMADTPEKRQMWNDRGLEAAAELSRLKTAVAERKQKIDQFESDFEDAVTEAEPDLQEKLNERSLKEVEE